MSQELIIGIIKWTLIVFIAGFIGYFGKRLAKVIIDRSRKKEPEAKKIIHQYESPEKYTAQKEKYKAKLEKKKLKLEKKKLKGFKKKK